MKKILMATKCANDMTSFLRAFGIFSTSQMKKECQMIRTPAHAEWVFDWSYYLEADLIYMHRPSNVADYHIMERARQLGVPVWVDCDDDLENVTPDNPVYLHYSKPETKEIIQHCMGAATVLSCGGIVHQKRLEKEYNRRVILIPNALDERLLKFKKPFTMNNKISWRGSESHRTDLLFYQKEIETLMDEHPDKEWIFSGFNPYFLNWSGKRNLKWLGQMNIGDFYTSYTATNASIAFHPLTDTVFNRVKSNLCWNEASLAGSVIIAPEHEEYLRPGVWGYIPGSTKDFYTQMKNALNTSEAVLRGLHAESWKWIEENIMLSKVNLQRIEILRNL